MKRRNRTANGREVSQNVCLAIKSDLVGQLTSSSRIIGPADGSRKLPFRFRGSQNRLPGIEDSASSRRCTNSAAEGICSREGFCPSTPVLALAPTTPNPTIYGLNLYQTCTFSAPFRRKPRPNCRFDCEPVLSRANPKIGRPGPVKPSQNIARNLSPRNPASLAARAKDEICLPGAHQRNLGPFPPQETAF